jgi:hypothetical protein
MSGRSTRSRKRNADASAALEEEKRALDLERQELARQRAEFERAREEASRVVPVDEKHDDHVEIDADADAVDGDDHQSPLRDEREAMESSAAARSGAGSARASSLELVDAVRMLANELLASRRPAKRSRSQGDDEDENEGKADTRQHSHSDDEAFDGDAEDAVLLTQKQREAAAAAVSARVHLYSLKHGNPSAASRREAESSVSGCLFPDEASGLDAQLVAWCLTAVTQSPAPTHLYPFREEDAKRKTAAQLRGLLAAGDFVDVLSSFSTAAVGSIGRRSLAAFLLRDINRDRRVDDSSAPSLLVWANCMQRYTTALCTLHPRQRYGLVEYTRFVLTLGESVSPQALLARDRQWREVVAATGEPINSWVGCQDYFKSLRPAPVPRVPLVSTQTQNSNRGGGRQPANRGGRPPAVTPSRGRDGAGQLQAETQGATPSATADSRVGRNTVCWLYNAGRCRGGCGREHICRACRTPDAKHAWHTQQCPKFVPPPVADPPAAVLPAAAGPGGALGAPSQNATPPATRQ